MCCFSGKVQSVADTNIFARASKDVKQLLVYSMRLDTKAEVAMILPIPVPKASKEDAVRFISLEKYPDFFDEMRSGFPVLRGRGHSKDAGPSLSAGALKVVEVGSFIASFVPSQKDFSRLDEKFRLPAGVWDKLPQYKDWGFAVFQLKKGDQKVHPMAFEFPRANPKALFFPTVHIHDGTVHPRAHFDHMLFCQINNEVLHHWEESPQTAELFMKKLGESQGLVEPRRHVYRRILQGMMKNEDVVV
jgi:hypothetical protein